MRVQDVDIDKPLEDYFSHKPGEILTAPDTGDKFEVFDERYFTTHTTSWIGYSIGAIHYYARIELRGISTGYVGSGCGGVSGYLGGLEIENQLIVELTRPITDGEREDDPDRFSKYQTVTHALLTEESAEQVIKDFLEEYKDQLKDWRNGDVVDKK
jgi:hypothetical protein